MARATAPTASKKGGSKTRVVTRKVTTPPRRRRSQAQCTPAPASRGSPRRVPGPAATSAQPRRGRPRELPSRLPQLLSLVAVAPELREIVPRSSRSITEEERVRMRVAKQAAVAEVLARQRARRQLEQMAMAFRSAQLQSEKNVARLRARLERQEAEASRLDQLRLRLEAGDDIQVTSADARKVRRVAGFGAKKPRVSAEDHRLIVEFAGAKTQASIAEHVGVCQSTVSRHIHLSRRSESQPRGRKPVMTAAMVNAAARFQFIFNTRSWLDTARFIRFAFGVKVSPRTVSRHLKSTCGFRLGDFRRFPRDRNSQKAIDERYVYATEMPNKYGQNSLYHGIYFDEMKLSRVSKCKAWSIGGWIPTVENEFDSDTAEHITLLLAAAPALGVTHAEIVEGSVTGETVRDFMKAMMTEYLQLGPVATGRRRAFIMDNARIHHRDVVQAYLNGDETKKWIALEFLPTYSPFYNPLEEVFGLIKSRLWRRRTTDRTTDESKAFIKKALVEEVRRITEEDVRSFYFHVEQFLKFGVDRLPVFTQQLYESSHVGDEVGLCPLLPDTVELLLNTFLPHSYEDFTPEMNAAVENEYGISRLTVDILRSRVSVEAEEEPRDHDDVRTSDDEDEYFEMYSV